MQARPTIKDVAARAGVSRQTVSRVLNDKGEIRPETRARVLAAIEELGYWPSAVARSMVVGHTCTLGCISPNLTDFTFANIIEGAQAEAHRLGYLMLIGSAHTEAEVPPLLEEMLRRRVDGLLVVNPRVDGRYRHLLPLIDKELAVVYLNNTPDGEAVSSVRCDDREGGYQATQRLLGLGHQAIATILGPGYEECAWHRLDGYRQALDEAGLCAPADWIMQGDWSATSGYHAMQALLAADACPTALFAQNDQMAVGAIRALREAGRGVPEDVSLIGFDDIPLASYFDPPLTTLRQPMQESGQEAVRLLVDTIQNPGRSPEQVLLQAHLIERSSCATVRSG